MNLKRTTRLVLLGVSFIGLRFSAQADEARELTKAQYELLVREGDRLSQRGHYVLDGTVVDETGKPIPSFQIVCQGSRTEDDLADLRNAWRSLDLEKVGKAELKTRHPLKLLCKDGKYHIDVKNLPCDSFYLEVTAEGYYNTSLSLTHPLTEKEDEFIAQAVLNGLVLKEVVIQKTLPPIRMTKKGKLTKLEKRVVEIRLSQKGDRVGFQLTKEKADLVKVPVTQERLPSSFIYVSAKRGSDAAFEIKEIREQRGTLFQWHVPVDLQLQMAGSSSDGFLFFKVQKDESSRDDPIRVAKEPLERKMWRAPAERYRLTLAMSTADLTTPGVFAFYFKCGGLFGRARLQNYAISADKSEVTIKLWLEWQPDGSRNLETGE